jgi:hypothetical protein
VLQSGTLAQDLNVQGLTRMLQLMAILLQNVGGNFTSGYFIFDERQGDACKFNACRTT